MKLCPIQKKAVVKSELVNRLANRIPCLQIKEVKKAADLILENVTLALSKGNRVEIRGLGALSIKEVKGRISRNPKTGQTVVVPPRKHIFYKPSKHVGWIRD